MKQTGRKPSAALQNLLETAGDLRSVGVMSAEDLNAMKTRILGENCYISMPLDRVEFGQVSPDRFEDDPFEGRGALWLQDKIGFYPQVLYFADSNQMAADYSGYSQQWRRWWHDFGSDDRPAKVHAQKGNPRNQVLAVFKLSALERPVFIDDEQYCHVLNDVGNHRPIKGVQLEQRIFKRSWKTSDWLRLARQEPISVSTLVPHVDLREAVELWVRNKATKRSLEAMGFHNVCVKRLHVRKF